MTGDKPGPLADRWWFLIAFVIALVVFAATDTGRVVFDTKLGVDINPAEFLQRLWSLWNPLEWFGSLQDQYIGYAIPMVPFFLIGQLFHVPIWLTERLWLALLIAVGFTGMIKLARALGVGSNSSRLIAGTVFALWPTFTIAINSTSAAALPGLVVPWAVLPLIAAVQGRSTPGRAAARSGLAIAAMAGVNAASTLAVLVLPALYIVTHTKGRRRLELGLKWVIAVFAATAWWVIPLLLQSRYAFNFLPYIEQSATTARTMSAAAVLRGMGTWTAYFNLGGSPWLPGGWIMATSVAAILASATASAAGLAGLARRDMPERRWLASCAGLVAIVALAGYYGPLGGPFHAGVDGLLDGALAPFRSTYKLEPVLAVALALGCAHLTGLAGRLSIPLGRSVRVAATAAMAPLAALVLVGLAVPQLSGASLQSGSFASVPRYWTLAAQFLAAHSPRETALVVPANPHGQFTWGNTIDDPLEPLASSPWVERGLVPLGGAGSQVLLETAERAIESGQQVQGLAAYLARAGIRYVLVRNDTNPTINGYVAPQVVNETLALSGFHRVAGFGPRVAAAPEYPNVPGQVPGFALTYPAIEIFTANNAQLRPDSPVAALPVGSAVLVNGGPDSLLQLAGQGILSTQPTVIAGQQLAGRPALWAVTDGQRRVDNNFGSTSDYQSYAYTATEKNPADDPLGGAGGPPRQLLPVPAAGHQTVAILSGAASVTASSAGTWLGEAPQYNPVNAFDGNPATAWAESSPVTPVGQWIQINFGHRVDLPSRAGIELLVDSYARSVANQLLVTTAAGSASTETVNVGSEQPLRLPAGPTSWLRITITGASNVVPGDPGAGISEVVLPGIRVSTFLQPAEDRAGAAAPAVAYSFAQEAPPGQGAQAISQSLDRQFVTAGASQLTAQITAVPVRGPGLEALITRLSPTENSDLQVTATSTWNSLPTFGPSNLFAQKPGRPWLAAATDPNPTVTVSWRGRRTISELVLEPAYGLAAEPTGVLIGSPAGNRLATVGLGGIARVSPPLRTHKLRLTFISASSSAAGNTAIGQPAQLPIGLAGLRIPALSDLRVPVPNQNASFRLACGSGPVLSIGGHSYQTAVIGTVGALIRLEPVQLSICSPDATVTVPAGLVRLSAAPSSDFVITSLGLRTQPSRAASRASAGESRRLQVRTWQPDNRVLAIGPGAASYVEIHENANPGWVATMNGRRLTEATLDGWEQAFVVPAGSGGVISLTYEPTTVYHAGIVGSALALLILLVLAIRIGRPRSEWSSLPADDRLDRPRPDESPVSWRRALVAHMPVAVVVVVSGGLTVIAVPVLAAINYRRARWLPVIAGCAMFAAGVVAATARTPSALGSGAFSGPAQAFALIALAAALTPAISAKPLRSAVRTRSQQTLARRPFSVPDEMACHFDTKAEPFNIHFEMRIPGRLDRDAFHAAAVAALIANPHASAKRAPHGLLAVRYAWEQPEELDRDPVLFVDVADDAHLALWRAAFMSRSPSIDVSPAASLLVATGPDHDYVILNGHHAAMDALSWLDLLRDIGRRYRSDDPDAGPTGAQVPQAGSAGSAASITLPGSAGASRRWRLPARPARIAKDGASGRGYGLHLLPLPEVPAVRPFSTGDKATLNEALITALIAAIGRWNAAHARPARRIRITTPFNARSPGDVTAPGNLSRLVTVAGAPPPPGSDLVPLLTDVARQARSARQRPGHQVGAGTRMLAALYCPALVKRLVVHTALRTAGPLLCDTAMLTNVGDAPSPPDFGVGGSASMAFSAQAQMPRGLSVGAITADGQFQLALRFNRALFDEAAADRFGTTLLTALSEITTQPGQAQPGIEKEN